MFQLPSPLVSSFFILLLTIIFNKWRKSKHLNENKLTKLPPSPKKLPLIGNLHQMAGGLPHHSLSNLAKKYGPIMSLQLGEILTIIITSPKLVKEILKTQELAFAQRPELAAVEVMSYENSSFVFSPYGEYWRQMRKIVVLELLSMKRVMSFRSIREQETWNMVKSISDHHGKRPVNLSKLVLSLINDITSRAAFGERCKYGEEFISFLKEVTMLAIGFELPDLFPSIKILRYTSRMKPTWERLHREIDVILNHIIEEHKAKLDNSVENDDAVAREDLVDLLLNLQKTSELKFLITMDVIKNVLMEIFSAGTDTSSTTLEWAMSEMLRNPKIMQKAQAEVREHMKGKPRVSESDVQSLEYLKLVVKETLRLHPPGPLMARESRETCQIGEYEIPAKTMIIINIWALGRDPEYWPSAEEFNPERFMDASIGYMGSNFEYIPFGGGRRICPGINFGLANIELPLAQLLYHFDWKLPDEIKPEELDMTERFGINSRRKNDLVLIAKPYVEIVPNMKIASDDQCIDQLNCV